jgi:hypothetical protein
MSSIAQEQLTLARMAVASIDLDLAEARTQAQALSMEYRTAPSFELQQRVRAAKDIVIKHFIAKKQLEEDLLAAEFSAQLQFA